MAPVCVRVAFIGGGQGEPSRWAGPHGAHRAARRASGIVANQNEKKLRGGMRGSGSARRRDAWGGVGLQWRTRGGSGPKVSKRRVPGGNRQSEGTKAKPRKPNDFNGFRGSNPGGGYEIRTREAVTPTRFPSVRHRPLGESSMLCSAQLNCVPQATRISYHRFRISARFGVARVATRM